MNGAQLAQDIESALAPWNGGQLKIFSSALGNGITTALIGKLRFTTTDSGVIPGAGIGNGIGIKGLDDAIMAQLMFAKGQSTWAASQNQGPGTEWMVFCSKISLAVKKHLGTTAILKSTHAPVFTGSGKVLAYSGVTADAMSSAIVAAAPGDWAKARFPELALAVATGVMTNILTHAPTDVQVISGAPAGTPSGGSGTGAGVVT